ncbi:MAG: hypothetical protein RL380_536 [Verrucomicrobiota bacterium]|jgi:uncharacterized protein YdaL
MRFPSLLVRVALTVVLVSAARTQAQPLARLTSAKGADAKTLVIYSETRAAYSLAEDLAALKLQLRRVAGSLEAIPAAQADAAKVAAADYVVVFCPQPFPKLDAGLVQVLAQTDKPTLWVGYGADLLAKLPPFKSQFNISPFASDKISDTVSYHGRELKQPMPVWLPVQWLNPADTAAISLSVLTLSLTETNAHPICFKSGAVTFYTALPTSTAAAPIFGDVLLDFYGVANPPGNLVGIRIDGYHCRQDHLEFRHLVDYLHEHAIPFTVGVIPAFFDPANKKQKEILDLESQPEFVSALRYAQANGGRLVLQGFVNSRKAGTGQEPEFWDASLDRPYADDTAEDVRLRLTQGARQMIKKNLFPLAWETPFNSASRTAYAEIASHFSTAVERIQLSDASGLENFASSTLGVDDFGRTVISENLGVINGQRAGYVQVQERAELLAALRGTIAVCSFPAYLDDGKLAQTIGAIKGTRPLYLDLADGDHWMQLSDLILLTGQATRTVTLKKANITWKAYDRAGKLIISETESQPVTGERQFKRRGTGDIEIFEINEAPQS